LRSALADLIDSTINTGGGTAKLRFRATAATIVDIPLQNPAFGSASSGVITLEGVPISANATGTGDVDNFQILDRGGTVQVSGTVTVTGMGGDITIDNISINSGQEVIVSALTYTAPV
jgi:hypothetical protein